MNNDESHFVIDELKSWHYTYFITSFPKRIFRGNTVRIKN